MSTERRTGNSVDAVLMKLIIAALCIGFAFFMAVVVAVVVILLIGASFAGTESEFVLRRLREPHRDFSSLILFVPVLFAFAVLFLILFFRQQDSMASLLKTLFVPKIVVTILTILWSVWLLLYIAGFLGSVVFMAIGNATGEADPVLNVVGVLLVWGLVPLILPLLLVGGAAGFFAAIRRLDLFGKYYLFIAVPWALFLLLYVGCGIGLVVVGFGMFEPAMLVGLVPVILYPALLGMLGMLVMCIRRPLYLLPALFVFMVSCFYLVTGLIFQSLLSWWVILVPMLMIALIYVGMMYAQDAQSVHPLWAAFLGLLRCLVYGILACVFLLPGWQTFNTRETGYKVLVLFDVSDSMKRVDELPRPGEALTKLPSRQDKIIDFLTRNYVADDNKQSSWLEHVVLKTPVTAYRFGAVLDDFELKQFTEGGKVDSAQWGEFLHPDRAKLVVPKEINGKALTAKQFDDLKIRLETMYDTLTRGTNISGSALSAAVRETGHKIQAIVIFSDGQSNLGTNDSMRELYARAASANPPIDIITVGVGKYLPPVHVRVGDVQAPQQARPDDKFPVKVPVYGDGLPDREFTVFVDANRVTKDGDKWKVVPGFTRTIMKKGKFKGGEHPYDTVEFDVGIRDLAGLGPKDESQDEKLEGFWEFKARVPRIPGEFSAEKEHITKQPAYVLIQKRKLRVLLFAGGPSREYQFVRTLLYREVQDKRVELTIFLQTGLEENIDQDVDKERLLTKFPDKIGKTNVKDQRFYTLSEYDVIIAFDPDWGSLETDQLELIKRWVSGPSAGGLIVVAGPLNTYQLARPGGRDISALQTILPVKLKDNRLHSVGLGHDSSRPYALHFKDNASQYSFLNLTENDKQPLEGWNDFFWDGPEPPAGKEVAPMRGMFNYYPVESIRPGSQVLATFAGPPGARINDGKDEMPFLVTMPYGAGKVFFIGAGEMWRLREKSHDFHQRFWIKLCRYIGSGNLEKLNNYGDIFLSARAATGQVPVEAQVLGEDLKPLPRDMKPVVHVIRHETVDTGKEDYPKTFRLEAKGKDKEGPNAGEWNGFFSGKFKVFAPGRYTLKIQVPGTSEELSRDITIYRPDPESDEPRPDHAHLYYLATSAQPVLRRLNDQKRSELLKLLQPPVREGNKEADQAIPEDKETLRLYFPLESADIIPDLLQKLAPDRVSTKGAYQDLWDRGWNDDSLSVYYLVTLLPAVLGALLCIMLLFGRQWLAGAILFTVTLLIVATGIVMDVVFTMSDIEWARIPLSMTISQVLLVIPAAIGLFTVAVLLTLKRWIFATVLLGVTAVFALLVFLAGWVLPDLLWPGIAAGQGRALQLGDWIITVDWFWSVLPLHMAYVLAAVVGLLALEWLTRKLLRLA
jgi:hypothetical protein